MKKMITQTTEQKSAQYILFDRIYLRMNYVRSQLTVRIEEKLIKLKY